MNYITQPKDYWISPNALYIQRNAMNDPNKIQASCISGANILVFVKGIINYDAGHNYRHYTLIASPTIFPTNTEKYVYAAIPRPTDDPLVTTSSNTAMIVFPSEQIDIYGINAEGQQIGSESYYYIFLQGILTSSGDNGTEARLWKQDIDTGYLDTNLAFDAGPSDTEWYNFNAVTGVVTFLKELTMKASSVFTQLFAITLTIVNGGSIRFGKDDTAPHVEGIANSKTPPTSATHIATPSYIDSTTLSKRHDDKTDYSLEMQNLTVNGKTDIFGNISIYGNAIHKADTTFGTYVKGILTGSGAQIDKYGNAELESLIIRRFLEVPELRYNRVSVHSGTDWFTKGSGLIETVQQTDPTHGIITLHLEDGEYGTVAADDYCMGIFHNLDGNATENQDDHKGILQYKGFTTVYFRITAVNGDHNQTLTYELRPVSAQWTGQTHPCSQMTFAAYANPNDIKRQTSVLKTTDYTVYLQNMNNWTFGPDNYYLIMGILEGFSVWATNQNGTRYLKALHGNGTMLGNVYIFGSIDQFDRLADHIDITVTPRNNSDFVIDDGETITLTLTTLSWDNQPRTEVKYTIRRNSDDPQSDIEWMTKRGTIPSDTITITKSDLNNKDAVEFTITATRQIPILDTSSAETEAYTVTREFVLRAAPKDGEPGTTYYTWIKYADDAQGSGISDSPTGKEYIGFAYNQTTPTASTNPSDYSWSLIKGEDGYTPRKGIDYDDGKDGHDGNGIDHIATARMFTHTLATPPDNSTGWIDSTDADHYPDESQLSTTNLYLWQRRITYYTQSAPTTDITLIGTFSDETQHVYCGEWKPSTLNPDGTEQTSTNYLYALGVRHCVRALEGEAGTMTYYRMRQRTTPTGYSSRIQPHLDPEHWERASYLRFVAADIILSEEVITDKLTVTKMMTSSNSSHIEIHDGTIEMYGSFAFPNIKLGIDSDGCTILSFYNKDGEKMYDLGPNGINKIDTESATFTPRLLFAIDTSNTQPLYIHSQIANVRDADCTTYYQFSPKRTTTGTTTIYTYGGSAHDTPPNQSGRYYQGKTIHLSGDQQDLPSTPAIPDGWYVRNNNGIHFKVVSQYDESVAAGDSITTYREPLYHFTDGRNDRNGNVQWVVRNGIVRDITVEL